MKSLRVWLLLVLVALLPLRGSLAATLLCHDGDAMADVAVAPHQHDRLSASHDHRHPPATADKCNLCSSLAAPACPLDARAAIQLVPAGSTLAPVPTLWPASFIPAKLERPPRAT